MAPSAIHYIQTAKSHVVSAGGVTRPGGVAEGVTGSGGVAEGVAEPGVVPGPDGLRGTGGMASLEGVAGGVAGLEGVTGSRGVASPGRVSGGGSSGCVDPAVLEWSRKLVHAGEHPRLQVVEKEGTWFTLNNAHLELCRYLEGDGTCKRVRVHVVPLSEVPKNVRNMMIPPISPSTVPHHHKVPNHNKVPNHGPTLITSKVPLDSPCKPHTTIHGTQSPANDNHADTHTMTSPTHVTSSHVTSSGDVTSHSMEYVGRDSAGRHDRRDSDGSCGIPEVSLQGKNPHL